MRASRSTATSSSGPRARRSRSACSSGPWPASRSASLARLCSSHGCRTGGCGRRSAGAPSPAPAVEKGAFDSLSCGLGEPAVRELLSDFADVRYVWRHLPLTDVHPHAQLAAEASEAAADQGAFWEMHDLLLEHQDALRPPDLVSYAERLELDVARFTQDIQEDVGANRIAQDVEGADLSGVSGTPTFFINGRRHHGAYDIDTLSRAVRAAGARAKLAAS